MEQYYLFKKMDKENLRLCLDNYVAERIYIRDCGGYTDGEYRIRGKSKVDESLIDKVFDFSWNDSLKFFIGDKEVYCSELNDYNLKDESGFTLAYERIMNGKLVMLGKGGDPYDVNLPEPNNSTLRQIIDGDLIEITFKGRVNLEFISWLQKPYWGYWKVI
jgi:hypothetical protein